MTIKTDEHHMQQALLLAKQAEKSGEVPVGAVIVYKNEIIAQGWNQPIELHDPSAHAEMIAIRNAAKKLGNYRLNQCTLYVTLEPCSMCVGAIIHARIERLVFGAFDPKSGAVKSVFRSLDDPRHNHGVVWVGGVLADESSALLKAFFQARRL